MPAAQWHHCPGSDNQADFPSRGLGLEKLINNKICYHGPQWLELETYECQGDPDPEVSPECVSELRATEWVTHGVLLTTSVLLSTVILITKYNNLQHLLQVTLHMYSSSYEGSRDSGHPFQTWSKTQSYSGFVKPKEQ